MEALASSPLDRLSVSLHTMNAGQFQELYRFSSLDSMRRNLDEFLKTRNGRERPILDFAFVALERNLDQLKLVASLAREIGVSEITIHPVIRRDAIPVSFPSELDETQRLRPGFKQRVLSEATAVSAAFPELQITIANPDLHTACVLTPSPRLHPGLLPADARIRSCEQNPWRTMHVLANGDLVACEVHDKTPLGNLARERLSDIWRGARYCQFRRAYHRAELPECRACPWKIAYRPGPMLYWISGAQGANPQLLAGWYAEEPSGIVWSEPRPGASAIRLHGFLPPNRRSGVNRLDVWCNGAHCGAIQNSTPDVLDFDATFLVERPECEYWQLRFETAIAFRGPEQQWNQDSRALGFALAWIQTQEPAPARSRIVRRAAVAPLAVAVYALDFAGRLTQRVIPPRRVFVGDAPAGLSVIVPERGNRRLLARCLQSIARACGKIVDPHETIVVINGSPESEYQDLRRQFGQVHWIHVADPLGFSAAVRGGVEAARYGWVYLANNDVELDPACLERALALRSPDVFAVSSELIPEEASVTRQETNWTDFHFANGLIEIYDVTPDDNRPRMSFYAGGGSSLFRTDILREFLAATETYDPFYWEDVEWAVRAAKKYGLRVMFAPESRAVHTRRATVSKFYRKIEVDRIFQRNAFLYQLRNVTAGGSRRALFEAIARSDWVTLSEILRRAVSALSARALTFSYAADDDSFRDLRRWPLPPGKEPV